MDMLLNFIDIFIHLDQHLSLLIQSFGGWAYLIVFLVIFCETGLVVTPICRVTPSFLVWAPSLPWGR